MLFRTGLLLLALFGFFGCISAAQVTGSLMIETDRALYGPHDTLTVSFTNGRPLPIYVVLDGCYSGGKPLPMIIRFERRERGEWVSFERRYVCQESMRGPAELAPGASYSARFKAGVLYPLPAGTYRYVFEVLSEAYLRPETLLPEAERTSNTFEIRE